MVVGRYLAARLRAPPQLPCWRRFAGLVIADGNLPNPKPGCDLAAQGNTFLLEQLFDRALACRQMASSSQDSHRFFHKIDGEHRDIAGKASGTSKHIITHVVDGSYSLLQSGTVGD